MHYWTIINQLPITSAICFWRATTLGGGDEGVSQPPADLIRSSKERVGMSLSVHWVCCSTFWKPIFWQWAWISLWAVLSAETTLSPFSSRAFNTALEYTPEWNRCKVVWLHTAHAQYIFEQVITGEDATMYNNYPSVKLAYHSHLRSMQPDGVGLNGQEGCSNTLDSGHLVHGPHSVLGRRRWWVSCTLTLDGKTCHQFPPLSLNCHPAGTEYLRLLHGLKRRTPRTLRMHPEQLSV